MANTGADSERTGADGAAADGAAAEAAAAARPDWDPPFVARTVMRAARVATLGTADKAGQPHVAMLTPACMPDLSVVVLLSGLSAHTRHLRDDGRCALLMAGPATGDNPQTAPRVSLTGTMTRDDDPACRARYLAVHPYAGFYAHLGDFTIWRFVPDAAQVVGGFARAARVAGKDLRPDPAAVAAVAAAAADIMAHCNADHADTLALLGGGTGAWKMVGVDVDGCDITPVVEAEEGAEPGVARVAWARPVADADGVRRALILAAHAARAGAGGAQP